MIPRVERMRNLYIVRDDDLKGGTKRRFLDGFVQAPYDEFVYASPAYGGAQIALAHACRAVDKTATIFVAKRAGLHLRTREAYLAGARIMQVDPGYLTNVQAKARKYAHEAGALLLPFGLDTPDAIAAIALAARRVKEEHGVFDEVWCAVGSGVLIRALQQAELGKEYFGVAVGKKDPDVGAAKLFYALEKFEDDAKFPPPYPSCSNYDAKVWRHVYNRSAGKVLVWNVMA